MFILPAIRTQEEYSRLTASGTRNYISFAVGSRRAQPPLTFLADTRTHTELQIALRHDPEATADEWHYGQANIHRGVFTSINFKAVPGRRLIDVRNNTKAIAEAIDPLFLDDTVILGTIDGPLYLYYSSSRELQRFTR